MSIVERDDRDGTMTLGQVVKALFEPYIVVDVANLGDSKLERATGNADSPPVLKLRMRFHMPMPEPVLDATRRSLEELVAMRKGLAHHLMERFNPASQEGCRAALDDLSECDRRIDLHLSIRRIQWVESRARRRQGAASPGSARRASCSKRARIARSRVFDFRLECAESLSGDFCAGRSMTRRSMCAKQEDDEGGGDRGGEVADHADGAH